MTETCSECRFWDRYTEGQLSTDKGDCRRRPPMINDRIMQYRMPGRGLGDWNEMELDLYVASAFPVTHETSWCGEFATDREWAMPC